MASLSTKPNRFYPSIPAISEDSESHTAALQVIREAIETHERRNADYLKSFIRFEELVDLGIINTEGDSTLTSTAKNSIEIDAGDLQLVNDVDAPGNSFHYGTSAGGVKGWFAIPTAGAEVNDLTSAVVWANVPDTNITLTSINQHLAGISKGSIVVDALELQLDGDSASPGNSFFYGTNSGGTKGWFASSSLASFNGLGIWRYRTETATPPSTGQLRFDNADIASATEFYLHETNDGGTDVSTFLDLVFIAGNIVYIQDKTDATKYVLIELGTVVDSGAYRTCAIADIIEGAGGEPSQNTEVAIITTSPGTGEINDLTAAVVWANVPDANITVGSVTQHVASINHDLLLNFASNEHFTEASIDHTAILNIGANTHAQIDTHLADVSIHTEDNLLVHLAGAESITGTKTFTGNINMNDGTDQLAWNFSSGVVLAQPTGGMILMDFNINVRTNNLEVQGDITVSGTVDGKDIAAHHDDATIHFTEGSIDHTALLNIGANTHAQIDTHIADATIHFTEASITLLESQITDGTILARVAAAEVISGAYVFTATDVAPAALQSKLSRNMLYLDGKEAIDGADGFLRLNQNGDFGSGIFTPGAARFDGAVLFAGGLANMTSGGELTAVAVGLADGLLTRPEITDFGLTHQTPTVSANAVTVDLTLGNSVNIDMDPATGAVVLTLSNPPATGIFGEVNIAVTMGTPSQLITWPGSVVWIGGGGAPDLSTVNNDVDHIHLYTIDGGTIWYGSFLQAISPLVVLELSELSDVNTSTPTDRNVLVADGVDWESRALGTADIQSGTFLDARIPNLAATKITSLTFADARIAASNVTQHEAALTILESQITNANILARVAGNEIITGVWSHESSSFGQFAIDRLSSFGAAIQYRNNNGIKGYAGFNDGGDFQTFTSGAIATGFDVASTGAITGTALALADGLLTRPEITDFGITHQTPTVSGNAVTVNLALGNSVNIDMDPATAAVVLTLSNPPASGTYGSVNIAVTMGTPAHLITWPGSVTWIGGGGAPNLSTVNNDVDHIHLYTLDGGTIWYGSFLQAISSPTVLELNQLSDVNTSTPTDRNVLVADGVDWESRALGTADIQSGTFLAARVPTHTGHVTGQTSLSVVVAAITGQTDIGANLIATDEILVSDSGVIRRADISRINNYLNGALAFNNYVHPNHSGHVSSVADGATTLLVAGITGQTDIGANLIGTDEVVVSDGGVIRRADISRFNNYFDANLDFAPTSHNHNASDINAGILAVLRGGTGVAVSTGSGSNVLSAGPFFTGTITASAMTMSSTLNLQDSILRQPLIDDYAIEHQVDTVSGNAVTVNLNNGNSHLIDLDPATADVTLTLTNPPASGRYGEVSLHIVMGTPAHGITWPGSVTWQGGSSPVLSLTNNDVDVVHLYTLDAGVNWYGTFATAISPALPTLAVVTAEGATTSDLVTFTGGVIIGGGTLNLQDRTLIRPAIDDYCLLNTSVGVVSNAVTITYSISQSYEVDLLAATGNCTITISGGPPTGRYGEMIVKVKQDTVVRTLAWAGGTFEWPAGTVPTLTATASAFDIFHFSTWDAGTTWWGSAIQDVR